MRGPREDRVAVLRGEQRHEQRHPGEVEPPVAEHREQPGVPARGARDRDAPVGLGLGEVKGLGAVDEHRGEGLAREQTALVDLADVGDEVGLDAARLADELVQSPQQLVVGDVAESDTELQVREPAAAGLESERARACAVERDGGLGFHELNIGRRSSASLADERRAQRATFFSRESPCDCAKRGATARVTTGST